MIGFDTTPADWAPADGFFHRTEENDVHELAIVEALEQDGDEKRPVFVRLEQERQRACQDVDDEEAEEEEDGAFDVGGRPDLR